MPAPGFVPVQYDTERKIRYRNKGYYRVNHWPIWITVFFLAPGPLTFDLFEKGFDWRMATWLGAVLAVTGYFGIRGLLPGCEASPYIIRFTEDKPNPLYRRICYTFAWSAVISYATLNLTGLTVALITGHWYMKQIYWYGYFPIAITVWVLGLLGRLPRVLPSTKGEGYERRWFYGSVWAVSVAQPVVGILWKILGKDPASTALKLGVFLGILTFMGTLAYLGRLPRTKPIVPGELAVSD
ncbi:MAG: hypothetical protein SGI92_09550 [Bryobacteraceae bacterium]|nr:hypothetical protein [Bryobacteraceae bacterium]